MTRRRGQDIPDEGPSERDLEAFGGVTRNCPECSEELYDDVEICPHCGHVLGERKDKAPPTMVIIVVFVMLLAIVLFWVIR